jgi:hypothetical protein
MPENEKFEQLAESLKKYAATNLELAKLETTEMVSVIGSDLISSILILIVLLLGILFLSLWAAFYLSALLDDRYSGFGIVAGFYMVIALVLMICKKRILERLLKDRIVHKICNKT